LNSKFKLSVCVRAPSDPHTQKYCYDDETTDDDVRKVIITCVNHIDRSGVPLIFASCGT